MRVCLCVCVCVVVCVWWCPATGRRASPQLVLENVLTPTASSEGDVGVVSVGRGAGDVGAVSVGSLVIARWRNNSWYPATVTDYRHGQSAMQYSLYGTHGTRGEPLMYSDMATHA